MARYIRDPRLREFNLQIQREVKRIGDLARGRGYVIYVIRDVTLLDVRRRHSDGPPIYVGESKQMHVRADAHMKDGGRGTAGGRCKADRLHTIMKQFRVPKFQIVDDAPTHLTALIAETVWARRYRYLGYELANKWAEHQSKEAPDGLRTVPAERLLELTVEEALADEVGLELHCRPCGIRHPIPLASLRPSAKLNAIDNLKITCACSGAFAIRAVPPHPETWKWASYRAREMTPDC